MEEVEDVTPPFRAFDADRQDEVLVMLVDPRFCLGDISSRAVANDARARRRSGKR